MFVLGDVSGVGLCFAMASFWMRRSVCKELSRNGQSRVIASEAAYILSYPITRSPAQGPACKDLGRNGQSPAVTFEAADILAYAHNALPGAETCV